MTDALHAALGRIARIVERRHTIQILGHLLLDARADGTLSLRGTDLDIEATTSLAADVSELGRTTAPAHLLADIVSKTPSGAQIRMELDGGKLILKAGRSRVTLNVLAPEDFPDVGPQEATHTFEIGGADLIGMIGKTDFAISSEETRYYLNGIFLHSHPGEDGMMLRAVATDGHRLARFERLAPRGCEGMPGIIVPRKACAELKRLAKDATAPLTIAINPGRLTATIPGKVETTRLATKLIDGTFPDYERVIPKGNDKIALVDREGAIAAAGRVACVSSERSSRVKLSIADDQIRFSVADNAVGEAADEIEADYSAAPVEIGFNGSYLAEALGILSGDRVRIDLADPGSPTLFRETADAALLLILMPMRV